MADAAGDGHRGGSHLPGTSDDSGGLESLATGGVSTTNILGGGGRFAGDELRTPSGCRPGSSGSRLFPDGAPKFLRGKLDSSQFSLNSESDSDEHQGNDWGD